MKHDRLSIDIERIVLTDLEVGHLSPQELHWRMQSELEKELNRIDVSGEIINKELDRVQGLEIDGGDVLDSSMLATIVAKRVSSSINEEVFRNDHNP